jgi:hypothetical protein
VRETVARENFASPCATAPALVGSLATFDGIDAAGFDATVQEDRRADAELRHAPETLDHIAFAGVGALSGFEPEAA